MNKRYLGYCLFLSLAPVFFMTFAISVVQIAWERFTDVSLILASVNAAASGMWIALSTCSWFALRLSYRLHPTGRRIVQDCTCENMQVFTFYLSLVIPIVSLGALGGPVGFTSFWISVALAVPLLLRTGSCVMNPVLVGFGFNLYRVTVDGGKDEMLFVSRRKLSVGEFVYPILISPPFYFDGANNTHGA